MAEVKNTFIQSKMNQDLDGRILPNGQYRYGKNIQISRSEGDDVGALENVLGTELLTTFGLTDPAYEIIGHTVDVTNDLVYVFITDYSDSSNNQLDNNITGQNNAFGFDNKNCFIGVYNDRANSGILLVGGDFLNFSKTHPITGANLVEDLLFWTDNRNQPRKINVKTAELTPFVLGGSAGYYTNEDTISVAKYYPFECISLLKSVPGSAQFDSSMTNKTERWLPPYCVAPVVSTGVNTIVIGPGLYTNIKVGVSDPVVSISGVTVANDPTTGDRPTISVVNTGTPPNTTITVSINQAAALTAGDLIYISAENPDYNAAWPGDETFLNDKFVRFSYRFEFDDGEYSLMAPFTQACFVPKQDGYFLGDGVATTTPPVKTNSDVTWNISDTLIGDEGKAYSSSIVEFFENKVQDIGLYIPAPYTNSTQSTFNNIESEFKIKNIEIIYKESESTVAYVLDTISADEFRLETSSFYSYDYQSRKPWKTLREKEITRVYDKVPIRALAQESSGNRIIYGNFVDKHTSPNSLSYVVGIDAKPILPTGIADVGYGDRDFYVRKEYQNHTVKQNRTYQVGVVLSDRYGRQSDVILSDIFNDVVQGYGSTIYHPYRTTQSTLIDNTDTWPGDQINMIWHQIIPETLNKEGYPGIYKNNDTKLAGLSGTWTGLPVSAAGCCFRFIAQQGPSRTATFDICADASGNALFDTFTLISSDTGWTEGSVSIVSSGITPLCALNSSIGSPDVNAIVLVDQNTLGWYSWKIVVKQTEQEYYNCYLPGILAGYPKDLRSVEATNISSTPDSIFPKGDESKAAHIVLINDNINKIPRDLSEIGPQQKVFGSSVKLFGRVENYKTATPFHTYNRQFDPDTLPDTVVNIGNLTDLNLGAKVQAGTENQAAAPLSYPETNSLLIPVNFYNGITNPIVAEVSTKNQIGYTANDGSIAENTTLGMIPYLAIYETAPVTSDLDIYWETSTGGLVSELNFNIENVDNTTPCDITDVSIDWSESDAPGTFISDTYSAVSCSGVELDDLVQNTTVQLISVQNGLGSEKVNEFEVIQTAGKNEYRIKIGTTQWEGYFLAWNDNARRTWTFTFQIDRPATTLTQAISFQTTRTVQVQNANPDQIGMFDTDGTNNARTDIHDAVYNASNLFGNFISTCSLSTGPVTPNFVVGGSWQENNIYAPPGYAGNANNIYYDTFGVQYNTNSCFPADLGWGADDDGTQNYGPTFNTGYHGQYYNGPTIDLSYFLDKKIVMLNAPTEATPPWDGVFKAFNGAYGTTFGTPYPQNPNRGRELVYSIARAYQVSAFYPYQVDICDSDPDSAMRGKYMVGELIFSEVGGISQPVANSWPDFFLFGWGGYYNTTYAPTGPIYWDYEHGNILDPANYSTGGEATVGQRYLSPKVHYWKGLAECSTNPSGGPSMLTLQTPGPGSNPLAGSGTGQEGFWYVNAVHVPQTGFPDWSEVQLGLAQACGHDSSAHPGHIPRFRIEQPSGIPDPYQPQEAWIKTDDKIPMPPGRYVVTVRVTDRSVGRPPLPSGDGMYFEWDIPVMINGPFISNTGTHLVRNNDRFNPVFPYQTPITRFSASAINTFPWKDL